MCLALQLYLCFATVSYSLSLCFWKQGPKFGLTRQLKKTPEGAVLENLSSPVYCNTNLLGPFISYEENGSVANKVPHCHEN